MNTNFLVNRNNKHNIMQLLLTRAPDLSCGGSMSLKTWTVSVLLDDTKYMSSELNDKLLIWMNLHT